MDTELMMILLHRLGIIRLKNGVAQCRNKKGKWVRFLGAAITPEQTEKIKEIMGEIILHA